MPLRFEHCEMVCFEGEGREGGVMMTIAGFDVKSPRGLKIGWHTSWVQVYKRLEGGTFCGRETFWNVGALRSGGLRVVSPGLGLPL